MPPEDSSKLNRLEQLKSKLFSKSYQNKMGHRDDFTRAEIKNVDDSWENEGEAQTTAEKFFMKTSLFKKFFIFSICFFVLALLYGSYVFFAGDNTVSNENIDISVLGNNFVAGGEELPLIIGITNKNNAPLELVDLVVDYPKGSKDDPTGGDTEHARISLGNIPAGAVHNENFKAILFGEQGAARTLKISIEYRVGGSNAIFIKTKLYNVNINSSPLNLTVDGPSSVSPNQDVTLNIKATLNATKPAQNMLVKVDYPFGFSYVSATPAPAFGNNVWNLGDLAPGTEHAILLTGKMVNVFDGEEKTFNISAGSANKGVQSIGVVFNSIKHILEIQKAFVEANLFINGVYQREYGISAGTPVTAEIRYANNLSGSIRDITIEAKLSGNALDRTSIHPPQGYYDSSRDTIVWDKSSVGGLEQLEPGDAGTVDFAITALPSYDEGGSIRANPAINIEVSVSGKQSSEDVEGTVIENSSTAVLKVMSDVGFAAKALYYSGPIKNSGPIPPKVEQKTTYTVTWTLTNTSNSISNPQVKSSIPQWVEYTGTVSPAGSNLTYNASSRQIVWNVGRIQKGAGVSGASPSVSFQISLKPSLAQVGSTPAIINAAILTGHDDFANVNVKVTKSLLTTRLTEDSGFPPNGGTVTN